MYEEPFEYRKMPDHLSEYINQRLKEKEDAFNGGCLGALADAIRICEQHKTPLPAWVSNETVKAIFALSVGSNEHLKKWKSWFARYKKDSSDYELYCNVKEAREHGAEWKDVYGIAASLKSNRVDEGRGEAVIKAYKRTVKRMKAEPYRYHFLSSFKPREQAHLPNKNSQFLWEWIWETINSGKPRKPKKADLG